MEQPVVAKSYLVEVEYFNDFESLLRGMNNIKRHIPADSKVNFKSTDFGNAHWIALYKLPNGEYDFFIRVPHHTGRIHE